MAFCDPSDPENDFQEQLNSVEFCTVVRLLEFKGNYRALWQHLSFDEEAETDPLRVISFGQFDPAGHATILSFRSFVERRFHTVEGTWRAIMNKCPKGRPLKRDFEECCRKLNWDGDSEYVFKGLALDGNLQTDKLDKEDLEVLQIGEICNALEDPMGSCRETGRREKLARR